MTAPADLLPPVAVPDDAPRRIRVAAVMDTGIVSGPGRQLAAVVAPLRERGVDVRLFVFQNAGGVPTAYRTFLERAGIEHTVIEFHSRFDRALPGAFRAALDAWAPDVVQTHSYRPTTLAWLARLRGARWAWIGFFHGTTNEDLKVRVYHWLDRRLLPLSDRVVVMSRTQLEHFAPRRAPVTQLYNAVIPVPSAAPSDATRALLDRVRALPTPRVGVVGRLSAEKGVDVMLHALRRLHDRGVRPSLVVAGDGPARAELETLAAALGVAEQTHFLGSVLPIEPLYATLDLLAIPSRSEGLPNVLLEALRADVPVVSTRVGAVPEVLDGSGAGRVVPPEDPAALADAVADALAEAADTERSEGARAARRAVVERFSLDARVDAHVRLYGDVLAARGARGAR